MNASVLKSPTLPPSGGIGFNRFAQICLPMDLQALADFPCQQSALRQPSRVEGNNSGVIGRLRFFASIPTVVVGNNFPFALE